MLTCIYNILRKAPISPLPTAITMNFNISPGFVEATATPLFTRFLSGGLLQKTFHDSVPQVTKAFSRWPHIIPFHLEVITQIAQKESPDSNFHPKEKNEPYLFTTVIWIWAPPPGSVRLHKSNLESVKTPISMPNIRWLSQLKISNQGYALIQWSLFLPKDLTSKTSMPPNSNNAARQKSSSGHSPKSTILHQL